MATQFGVGPSYVLKVRARLRNLGDAAPGPQHNHVPPQLEPLKDAVRDHLAATPDARLREVQAWLLETHKVRVSYSVLWATVARLGLIPNLSDQNLYAQSCRPMDMMCQG